jgi:hypothetical protein
MPRINNEEFLKAKEDDYKTTDPLTTGKYLKKKIHFTGQEFLLSSFS